MLSQWNSEGSEDVVGKWTELRVPETRFLDSFLRPRSNELHSVCSWTSVAGLRSGRMTGPTSLGGLEDNWRERGVLKSFKCGLYWLRYHHIAAHTFLLATNRTLFGARVKASFRAMLGVFQITCLKWQEASVSQSLVAVPLHRSTRWNGPSQCDVRGQELCFLHQLLLGLVQSGGAARTESPWPLGN